MPVEDRPREKMKRRGTEHLSGDELLQILIGSGVRGNDVRDISRQVWRALYANNYTINRDDLEKIHGLGDAKISKILSCVELAGRMAGTRQSISDIQPREVWESLSDLRANKREHFIILYLDSRSREIAREVVSVGTVNASIVHPREVFCRAVQERAVSILGVHNHPSNDPDPSDADLAVTRRLAEAGRLLGIEFTDHIIITKDFYYSIREHHENLFE